MTHAACCLLSVPCGVCGALQEDPCAEDCTAPSVCSCDSLSDPCCTHHYAEGGFVTYEQRAIVNESHC